MIEKLSSLVHGSITIHVTISSQVYPIKLEDTYLSLSGWNISEVLYEYYKIELPVYAQFYVVGCDNNVVNNYCMNGTRTFSTDRFDEYFNASIDTSEDKAVAAIECSIPLDRIMDYLVGKYPSFEAFVTEKFMEEYQGELEQRYINFDAIAEDWRHSYTYCNGFVFHDNA